MTAARAGSRAALVGVLLLGAAACSPRPKLDSAEVQGLGGVAGEVDQDRLMGTLVGLVSSHQSDTPIDCSHLRSDLDPPLCHLTDAHANAQLQSRFQDLGLSIQLQNTADPQLPTSNVIAEIPGTTHPEEVVLVGAHFDAFWDGADDNTSGAAALLELAQVLSQHKFDRTIRFVGFDLEELAIIGSGRYVNALKGEQLKIAIVYDCIGFYSSKPGSQRSLPGLPAPSTGDFLTVIANELSTPQATDLYAVNDALGIMKVVPLLAPRDGTEMPLGNLLRSDHSAFWLSGQPALFLTDTANFRNPNYHQKTDTIDTLDPASYAKAVRISAASIAYWAGGPL